MSGVLRSMFEKQATLQRYGRFTLPVTLGVQRAGKRTCHPPSARAGIDGRGERSV